MLRLGNILLDVRRVSNLTDGRSWDYAEIATIESLPVLQKVARHPSEVSLDVRVHPLLGKVGTLLADLQSVGDSGEVLPLQTDAGTLLGYFVLDSIQRKWTWTLPDGTIVDALLGLRLREHRAPDGAEAPRLAIAGIASPVQVTPALVDIDREPGDVALSEIVRAG